MWSIYNLLPRLSMAGQIFWTIVRFAGFYRFVPYVTGRPPMFFFESDVAHIRNLAASLVDNGYGEFAFSDIQMGGRIMSAPGGGFGTELPTMQQASKHVHEVNQQIQGQLSNLLSRLEPLMGAWAGGAAMSFQNLKQRWHDNATKLNEALRGIGDGLGQSEQTYQTHESTNVQDINRVAVNLD